MTGRIEEDAKAADSGSPEHEMMSVLISAFRNTALINDIPGNLQISAISRMAGDFIRFSPLGRAEAQRRIYFLIEANIGQADSEDLAEAREQGRS